MRYLKFDTYNLSFTKYSEFPLSFLKNFHFKVKLNKAQDITKYQCLLMLAKLIEEGRVRFGKKNGIDL